MIFRVELGLLIALAALSACVFGEPLVDTGTGTDTDTDTETGEPETHPCGPVTGIVTLVIDGDTVEIDSGERIRYLLVDTPETSPPAECWASQATEYNRELVEGRKIRLEYDAVCRDQFKRLLAYVTVEELDDLSVNRALLENGFACVLHIPPNGNQYVTEFQALEDEAKADGVGMWGACGTVACDQ